jgi:hypothetical protein
MTKNRELLSQLLIFGSIATYLIYKLSNLDYYFGDGNGYFYMAQAVIDGLVPYRDFLIADPPLLIYLLAAIKAVIGANLVLFLAVPPILEATSSYLIYLNLKKRSISLAFLAPLLYLFSFAILSTSDYVTGLHFVILLVNAAILLKNKPIVSGILWGLATLIKLYTIPGFLAFLGWLVWKKDWQTLKKTGTAYVLTGAAVMSPFMAIAPIEVIEHTILHQFSRPPGISKTAVFSFFVVKDFPLLIVGLLGLIWLKKRLWLALFASWLLFYLIFKDLYYVYLGKLIPWIAMGTVVTLEAIKNKWPKNDLGKNITLSLLMLILLSHIPALINYNQQFRLDGRFPHAPEVAEYVKQLEPTLPLYGSHEVAPLIALMTNQKLFNNYIDTNAQIFGSGALDKKTVSEEAAEHGVYLLTKVANLEINADLDAGFDGYFDPEVFQAACERLTIIDGPKRELFTDIGIYWCQSK